MNTAEEDKNTCLPVLLPSKYNNRRFYWYKISYSHVSPLLLPQPCPKPLYCPKNKFENISFAKITFSYSELLYKIRNTNTRVNVPHMSGCNKSCQLPCKLTTANLIRCFLTFLHNTSFTLTENYTENVTMVGEKLLDILL